MGLGIATSRRIEDKSMARFVGHLCVVSVLSFLPGCSSESPPADKSASGNGGTGMSAAGAPAGGAGTGGTMQAMGGSSGTQTGGAGAGAGGGGSGSGATGGAGGATGGAPPVGGAGAGAGAGMGSGGAGAAGASAGAGAGGMGTAGDMSMGGQAPGGAGGAPPANPLAHLAMSGKDIGTLLATRFSKQNLAFSSVASLPGDGYKTACEWYGSLGVAKFTSNTDLLNSLVKKFDPLKPNFVSAMTGGDAHVDRYIFGMVPLEIYLQTGDASYLPLGTQVADQQQMPPTQVRNAIDDMFMMTILQVQAYRATKDVKYLNFMSKIMVDYLKAQQANGLFFHNVTEAKVHWGRGNGWFAAGMAEIMRELPTDSADYMTIEAGYKKMMAGLVTVQSSGGLWYQVLDQGTNSSNWLESSGSAMFTYSMIAGVRRGILDAATYVPVIEKAWAGLQTKINAQGDVSDICEGTWYKASAAEYMALNRLTGDGHGQAPVLWAAAELLR
jgi:unsaturated rhamnogalacturonyl hydrolase